MDDADPTPDPQGPPDHLLTVPVCADTMASLRALAGAIQIDTETAIDVATLASVILDQYTDITRDDYCFDHRRRGCGDEHGQHRTGHDDSDRAADTGPR